MAKRTSHMELKTLRCDVRLCKSLRGKVTHTEHGVLCAEHKGRWVGIADRTKGRYNKWVISQEEKEKGRLEDHPCGICGIRSPLNRKSTEGGWLCPLHSARYGEKRREHGPGKWWQNTFHEDQRALLIAEQLLESAPCFVCGLETIDVSAFPKDSEEQWDLCLQCRVGWKHTTVNDITLSEWVKKNQKAPAEASCFSHGCDSRTGLRLVGRGERHYGCKLHRSTFRRWLRLPRQTGKAATFAQYLDQHKTRRLRLDALIAAARASTDPQARACAGPCGEDVTLPGLRVYLAKAPGSTISEVFCKSCHRRIYRRTTLQSPADHSKDRMAYANVYGARIAEVEPEGLARHHAVIMTVLIFMLQYHWILCLASKTFISLTYAIHRWFRGQTEHAHGAYSLITGFFAAWVNMGGFEIVRNLEKEGHKDEELQNSLINLCSADPIPCASFDYLWPTVFEDFVKGSNRELQTCPPAFWDNAAHVRLNTEYVKQLSADGKAPDPPKVAHHDHVSGKPNSEQPELLNMQSGHPERSARSLATRGWDGKSLADYFDRFNDIIRRIIERLLECRVGPCKELEAIFRAVLEHEQGKRLVEAVLCGQVAAMNELHALMESDENLKALVAVYFEKLKARPMTQTDIRYLGTKNCARGPVYPPLYLPPDIEVDGVWYQVGTRPPPVFTNGPLAADLDMDDVEAAAGDEEDDYDAFFVI
ncbi:hypothetical protein K438DRAFT_157337 [Mycena galopus ATCC 62051]|nr:hypothetical protein K438DRAFT_157337 [Mycena galopus ATCC 62051]